MSWSIQISGHTEGSPEEVEATEGEIATAAEKMLDLLPPGVGLTLASGTFSRLGYRTFYRPPPPPIAEG